MVLFIYGPSAVGKTVFLKGIQHNLQALTDVNVAVVYADLAMEYHFISGEYVSIRENVKWKGKRNEKQPLYHLDNMVGDDDTIWVVECMRYLNGLWVELIYTHNLNGGGLRIIVPYYTGEVGLQFRRDRCDGLCKELSDYWTVASCAKESNYRKCSCEKHLVPAGIPCEFVKIDVARKNWERVHCIIHDWLSDSIDSWYPKA